MNYTKGEWYLEEETGLILSIPEGRDSPVTVAVTGGEGYVTPKPLSEMKANAQLIASAPLLCETLKAVKGYICSKKHLDMAQEALARVEK